jgi:hypothetical protein
MVDVVAWALRFLRLQPDLDQTRIIYFALEAAAGTSAVISSLAEEWNATAKMKPTAIAQQTMANLDLRTVDPLAALSKRNGRARAIGPR